MDTLKEKFNQMKNKFGKKTDLVKLKEKHELMMEEIIQTAQKEFSSIRAQLTKNPEKTCGLIEELERRMKMVEDFTGEEVNKNQEKSVFVGIIAGTMHHGSKASCEQLKKVILEFMNNAARRPESTRTGVPKESSSDIESARAGESEDIDQEHFMGGFGKGIQCYTCNRYGHVAKNCPARATSKSKGKRWSQVSKYGKDNQGASS